MSDGILCWEVGFHLFIYLKRANYAQQLLRRQWAANAMSNDVSAVGTHLVKSVFSLGKQACLESKTVDFDLVLTLLNTAKITAIKERVLSGIFG